MTRSSRWTWDASQALAGYHLRISPALIEGFLAVYGDEDRYPGDTPTERRADVRMAWARLGLIRIRDGEVAITARRDSPDDPPAPIGFLESYLRNARVDSRSLPVIVEKMHVALSLFLCTDLPDGED